VLESIAILRCEGATPSLHSQSTLREAATPKCPQKGTFRSLPALLKVLKCPPTIMESTLGRAVSRPQKKTLQAIPRHSRILERIFFACLWEPRKGSKRECNSWLGFLDGLKLSSTPFALIISLISLISARVLRGLLARC
jgi:hypothetical protein